MLKRSSADTEFGAFGTTGWVAAAFGGACCCMGAGARAVMPSKSGPPPYCGAGAI